MLDAGSSHTSLYIYAWSGEKENDTGVVTQVDECTVQGKVKKIRRGKSEAGSSEKYISSRILRGKVNQVKNSGISIIAILC